MLGPKVVLCYRNSHRKTNLAVFLCLEEEVARKKGWIGDFPMECYKRATSEAMDDLESCITPGCRH